MLERVRMDRDKQILEVKEEMRGKMQQCEREYGHRQREMQGVIHTLETQNTHIKINLYNTATRNLVKVIGKMSLEVKRQAFDEFKKLWEGTNTPTVKQSVCTPKSWNCESNKGRNSSIVNYQQSNSKVIDKILDTKEINSSLSIQDIRNRSKKRLDKGSIPLDRQLSFKTEKPSIDNQRLVKQNSEIKSELSRHNPQFSPNILRETNTYNVLSDYTNLEVENCHKLSSTAAFKTLTSSPHKPLTIESPETERRIRNEEAKTVKRTQRLKNAQAKLPKLSTLEPQAEEHHSLFRKTT